MMFKIYFSCCIILLLCFTLFTQAETLRVPRDFNILQDAVNEAGRGDIILVSPGEYERITLNRKTDLTLISTDIEAENKPIIYGLPGTQVEVAVNMIECSDIEFAGFELTRGYSAIWLQNCDGIWIHHNSIHDLPDWWSSSVSVNGGSDILIERNIMLRSWHYGVYLDFGVRDIIVRNNVIGWMVHNDAVYMDDTIGADVYNNILIRNGDYGVFITGNCDNIRVAYNDFFENNQIAGGIDLDRTNIVEDPHFFDEENDDFHLRGDSPCIDAGDPDSEPDQDGTRADIGSFFFAHGDGAPTIFIEPDAIEGEEGSEHVVNISNEGNSPLWWRSFSDAGWISSDPTRGRVEPREDLDIFLLLTGNDLEDGIYATDLFILSNDPENMEIIVPVTMIVGDVVYDQAINLRCGWNLISLNITPVEEFWEGEDGPDIHLMTDQLRINNENHSVIVMKDEIGRFFVPEFDFCSIPFWDLQQAYLLKVTQDIVAFWCGDIIEWDAAIPLQNGWNFVPYYPTYELNAEVPEFYVLSSIIENVIMAKDNSGSFLSPQFEFSNMPPWQPGQGYQVNMLREDVLIYPEDIEQNFVVPPNPDPFRHWTKPGATGSNMSLLIVNINRDDNIVGNEVAAFDVAGTLMGVGYFDGENSGMVLWGDDTTTPFKEGLSENEHPFFRVWDGTKESPAEIKTNLGDCQFKRDELVVGYIEWPPIQISSSFLLVESFPNPYNSNLNLSFILNETSWVTIELSDIAGRHISTLRNQYFPSGTNSLSFDRLQIPSGLGFLKMSTPSESYVHKVIMQR